jgi:hypothetical protein
MFFITQYLMLLFRLEIGMDTAEVQYLARGYLLFEKGWMKLVSGGRVKRQK